MSGAVGRISLSGTPVSAVFCAVARCCGVIGKLGSAANVAAARIEPTAMTASCRKAMGTGRIRRLMSVERDIEEFAALDTLDMGAPITRTRGNRQRAVGMLRFYAGMATALHGETIENSLPGEIFSFTLKEPVGVVGAIIPWNGPLTATIWKIGPALATGCTVVLKPAEEAPLTAAAAGRAVPRGRACRRAWSTSCPASARPPAPRWPRTPTSTRSRSPART